MYLERHHCSGHEALLIHAARCGTRQVDEIELADIPRCFGEYELVEVLGHGGMGTVYRARHRTLERDVAIKVVAETQALHSGHHMLRFRQEARSSGRMPPHPNLVYTTDALEINGHLVLVMELVDGVDLRRLIRSVGPLRPGQAAAILKQAIAALEHLHQNGCIHRDIKPANLMLTRQGQVKLLDLGLARLDDSPLVGDEELTGPGHILGTPDYIPPEQWSDARDVDIRSDLYSLGCTWYFLLTGRPPFIDNRGTAEKMVAHCRQQPEYPRSIKTAGADTRSLLKQLLAKDRRRRPASPSEVARQLPSAELIELRQLFEEFTARSSLPDRQPACPLSALTETSEIDNVSVTRDIEQTVSVRVRGRQTQIGAILLAVMVIICASLILSGQKQQTKPTSPEPTPQQLAALCVVDLGGLVELRAGERTIAATTRQELPKDGAFTLTTVNLDRLDLRGADLSSLKGQETLTELSLQSSRVPPDMGPLIGTLTGLRILRLNSSTGWDPHPRLQSISKLKRLTLLSLDGLQVPDEELQWLTELPELFSLYLNYTPVSDAGLNHLAKISKLGYLWMDNTQLSDEGIETILQIEPLRGLGVKNTRITAGGMDRLRVGLPRADVMN